MRKEKEKNIEITDAELKLAKRNPGHRLGEIDDGK